MPEICHTHIPFCNNSGHFIELEFLPPFLPVTVIFEEQDSVQWQLLEVFPKVLFCFLFSLLSIKQLYFVLTTVVTHCYLRDYILGVLRSEPLSYSRFYLATICIIWRLGQCVAHRRYSVTVKWMKMYVEDGAGWLNQVREGPAVSVCCWLWILGKPLQDIMKFVVGQTPFPKTFWE